MATFNVSNLLNTQSFENKLERKKINYSYLLPHTDNHYSISDIEELADNIEDVGLLQNLVVKPSDNEGYYTIVIGHRRWNAIKHIVEYRENNKFEKIDCVVLNKDEDELLTELKLHTSNTLARQLTDYDKLKSIEELKRIYTALGEKGLKMKGKTRDLIAEQVGLKPTQVQKYISISEHADEETLDNLHDGTITVTQAYDKAIENKELKENHNHKEKPKKELDGYALITKVQKHSSRLRESIECYQENSPKQELIDPIIKIISAMDLLIDKYISFELSAYENEEEFHHDLYNTMKELSAWGKN